MFKSALAYCLVGYCVALLGLCLWLSHYQWPAPTADEPAEEVEEVVNVIPPDFKAIRDTAARKEAFFAFLTPLVEQENQRILTLRTQLAAITERAGKGKLTERDRNQLAEWSQKYGVEEGPLEQTLERLDRRINVIPVAMVLAQAASESAWGTSRFAREGNNYFGQWCFKAGCGIVPHRRREGAFHEVTRFASVQESLTAYFHNINTHSAYHALRLLRQEKTARGESVTAYELVGKLLSYSERGAPYIEELRTLIRSNRLEDLPPDASAHEPAVEELTQTMVEDPSIR
jgi:Bax protein